MVIYNPNQKIDVVGGETSKPTYINFDSIVFDPVVRLKPFSERTWFKPIEYQNHWAEKYLIVLKLNPGLVASSGSARVPFKGPYFSTSGLPGTYNPCAALTDAKNAAIAASENLDIQMGGNLMAEKYADWFPLS